MKLQGKVAVVTGAASGIGEAIAKLFAQEGARVVASDISQERLEKVVNDIVGDGGTAVAVVADVSDAADVAKMVDTAVEQFGTLDVLVNNAGIMDNFMPVHEVDDELWERVFAVNVTGPMRLIRKALPIMMEKGGGSIINVASVAGIAEAGRRGLHFFEARHRRLDKKHRLQLCGARHSLQRHRSRSGRDEHRRDDYESEPVRIRTLPARAKRNSAGGPAYGNRSRRPAAGVG